MELEIGDNKHTHTHTGKDRLHETFLLGPLLLGWMPSACVVRKKNKTHIQRASRGRGRRAIVQRQFKLEFAFANKDK